MDILVVRSQTVRGHTPGELFIDGTKECFTCEDPIRERLNVPVKEWKVPGDSAIPEGRYRLIVNYSTRFKKDLPLLLDVPGFSGVRIHTGNDSGDTEGCILVGKRLVDDGVADSRLAFIDLMILIDEAVRNGEEIWIELRNPPIVV